MTAPIRVLVVDDSPDITDMLGYVIGLESGLECVGSWPSAIGLAETIRRLHPDILVLDATMPGADPLVTLTACQAEFPGLRTIVYSGYDDDALIERVIDASAWGFVSKRAGADAVVRAIRAVAAGEVLFPANRTRRPTTEPGA